MNRRLHPLAQALWVLSKAVAPVLILSIWLVRPLATAPRVIDIIAAAPERGGFQPDSIHVQAGETVTLRFISIDLPHGIAIGPGLGVDLGATIPGVTRTITMTFEQGGTFTFYCNTWCTKDHWRMRGVLRVFQDDALPVAEHDPVIDQLIAEGVNIDAVHEPEEAHDGVAHGHGAPVVPSAARGETLFSAVTIPADLNDSAWRRSHTPEESIERLHHANPNLSEADLADVVAYLWVKDIQPAPQAIQLYAQNCAACHGPLGAGDGFAANTTLTPPVNFADSAHMFTMRADVLYAKIRRGGMGTDMPNFGTLFTPEETWQLVDYLWMLAFVR